MRAELKLPLGTLFKGNPEETSIELKKMLSNMPPFFSTVGDVISKNVLSAGLSPNLIVIDNKTRRGPFGKIDYVRKEVYVYNPPATIQAKAWIALRKAITLKSKVAIIVDGEEDLLVLPLMAEMPNGSVIAYGQPDEGIVVVTVTSENRGWAICFLNRMSER